MEPTELIIVEGNMLLCNEEARELFDVKVFIDVDDDVRLSRRVYNMVKNIEDEKEALICLSELLFKYEH